MRPSSALSRDAVETSGRNAMFRACSLCKIRMAKMLVEGGISPNIVNKQGRGLLTKTVLSSCDLHEKAAMVDFLIDAGTYPNLADEDGKTALIHIAEQGMEPSLISKLLHKGANPDIKDRFGSSYMDYARNSYSEGLIKLFMSGRKAIVARVDSHGPTKEKKMIQMLSDHLNLHSTTGNEYQGTMVHKQLDTRSSQTCLELEKLSLRDIRDKLIVWERELNAACEAKGIGTMNSLHVLSEIESQDISIRMKQKRSTLRRKFSLPMCVGFSSLDSLTDVEGAVVKQNQVETFTKNTDSSKSDKKKTDHTTEKSQYAHYNRIGKHGSNYTKGFKQNEKQDDNWGDSDYDAVCPRRRMTYDGLIGSPHLVGKRQSVQNKTIQARIHLQSVLRRRTSLPILDEHSIPEPSGPRQVLLDSLSVHCPGVLPSLNSGTALPVPDICTPPPQRHLHGKSGY